MEDFTKNLTVFQHPLISHKVTHLCDIHTGSKEFGELVTEITMLMGYEVLKDMKTKNILVEAPLATFESPVVSEDFTIVPILRAGLGMVDGLRKLYPLAKVGHVGLYRDENTLEAKSYYFKLPVDVTSGDVIVVDPALATGGSAEAAIDFLKKAGCRHIKFLCIFASNVGVERLYYSHPDVPVFTARYIPTGLNEKGYILTAAGDAGDRICGTCSYKHD